MSTNCIRCVVNKRTGHDLLCDDCRLTVQPLGNYLLISSGESYSTEIVKGFNLLGAMLTAMFGKPEECSDSEKVFWREQIDDPDNWHHDSDYGCTHYSTDVGETDHLEIYLLTPPSIFPYPEVMGRQITRENIMASLREMYTDGVAAEKKEDPGFVGWPDMVKVLKMIEEHGLPPKFQS